MPNSNDKENEKENSGERYIKCLKSITKESLEESYRKRYKEIESLRLYDLGLKHIEPVDLSKYLTDDFFP